MCQHHWHPFGPPRVSLGSRESEATTGPLGQRAATSVRMAIGRKWLVARYNRPGFEVLNYNSAPLKELQKEFGFELENVVAAAKEVLARA